MEIRDRPSGPKTLKCPQFSLGFIIVHFSNNHFGTRNLYLISHCEINPFKKNNRTTVKIGTLRG